jgi:hypothetical protein
LLRTKNMSRKRKNEYEEKESERRILEEHLALPLVELVTSYKYPRCMLVYWPKGNRGCDNIMEITNSEKCHKYTDMNKACVCAPNRNLLFFHQDQTTLLQIQQLHQQIPQNLICLSPVDSSLVYIGYEDYCAREITHVLDTKTKKLQSVVLPAGLEWRNCAVTETSLIAFCNMVGHNSGPFELNEYDDGMWRLVAAAPEEVDEEMEGMCANAMWVVLTRARYLQIYNRKTQAWTTLFFSETHCECFSLSHPVVFDDTLVLFPCCKQDGVGLNIEVYDLNQNIQLVREHQQCYCALKRTHRDYKGDKLKAGLVPRDLMCAFVY